MLRWCKRGITLLLHVLLLHSLRFVIFVVDNSGKITAGNEITPQSNYVTVSYDGSCVWFPRFDLSVTQCPVDVTWFPFDEQKCDLVFESWLLAESRLNVMTSVTPVILTTFLESNGWNLLGRPYLSFAK